MTTRKQIRDAAKAAIATVYAGHIYTGRSIDVRDDREFMHVYLTGGDISKEVQVTFQEATLVVEYNKDVDDDDLDLVIDAAHGALLANFLSKLALEGDTDGVQILPVNFEYGLEESQFSSVAYRYQITYTA